MAFGLLMLSSSCKKEEDENKGLPTVVTGENCEVHQVSTLISGECTDQGDSPVTQKGMVWDTQNEPTLEKNYSFSNHGAGTGSFKSSITNLDRNTTYYFRAYATNTQGTAYGEVHSFKTLAK